MEKVYIVTSGSYSDYKIEAVFTDKELAGEYQRRGGEDYDVEEYEINQPIPDVGFTVYMGQDGNVDNTIRELGKKHGFSCFINSWRTGKTLLVFTVKTEDEQRAVKVVNEKRAIILAHNAWGDDEKVKQLLGFINPLTRVI